jgi:hypothetical protein
MCVIRIPLVVLKAAFPGVQLKDIEFGPDCALSSDIEFRIWCVWSGRTKNDAAGEAERASTFLWAAEFQGRKRCGLKRKRLYGLGTNGGSHNILRLLDVVS